MRSAAWSRSRHFLSSIHTRFIATVAAADSISSFALHFLPPTSSIVYIRKNSYHLSYFLSPISFTQLKSYTMDAALAQLSHHQASPRVVPPEIHQPLLDIAKQGYDANDVTNWYLSVKRDLHRVETASAQTSYSLTPPFSVCSPVPPDLEVQPSDDGGTSPVERNTGPQAFYETPTNNTILWSESFMLNGFQQNQFNTTTPASIPPLYTCTSTADERNSIAQLSSPWSATQPTFPNFQAISTPATQNATDQESNIANHHIQWYNPDPSNTINSGSKKRRASQPPPYHLPMSSTPMPLILPSESSTQANYPPFAPVTTSTEVTYLPPISIIPSRKRRKTLPKGVKKFIQPLQLQRQS